MAQSFEEMVEDTLKRLRGGEPPAEQPLPPLPSTPSAPGAPGAPPETVPQFIPVEPGPRPYTPPKIDPPPDSAPPTSPPPAAATPAPSAEVGAAPAAAASPDAAIAPSAATAGAAPGTTPGVELPADPLAERTRESLTPEEVNAAIFPDVLEEIRGASPLVLKAQALLDRAGASPGAIDAYQGSNLSKAVAAVETVLGLPIDGVLDREVWDAIGGDNAPAVLVQYTITPEDLAYPFVPTIPADYAEQAKLPSLGYMGPGEMFGERFHMDSKLLRALNPTEDFSKAGTPIWVTAVESTPIVLKVAHIVVDKGQRQVRAYDAADHLIVAYPATIGSPDNPSPTGEHVVKAVAPDPVYYYDPANFVQGANTEKLQLPPGPNSPVGSVWIDLSDPGYGIHGTPEPTRVDKTGSHGCVRLTNWDAEELASLVAPGTTVSFTE